MVKNCNCSPKPCRNRLSEIECHKNVLEDVDTGALKVFHKGMLVEVLVEDMIEDVVIEVVVDEAFLEKVEVQRGDNVKI